MSKFKIGDRVRDLARVAHGTGTVTQVYDYGEILVEFDSQQEAYNHSPGDRDGHYRSDDQLELVTTVTGGSTPFEQNVRRILTGIGDLLVEKNAAYGDSALNPVRVFSRADRLEQLNVRIDDKISRIQRGSEYPGDDTIRDLIGYLALILIARESLEQATD